ncbi:hypothetical protein [Rhizobium lusitanum]|jgi:hypothetical protein|uniref:hypothetical protein n=1 Tax=Rhizobium lusitanum TaxID=293958 RepID=UPI000560D590|nr:hypothetical protein [Rhizobium lusitanum]NTJ07659.1 hypothetical protein [Rhizobium lusitanum]
MSEMLRGFLACIGAALFFGGTLAAIKSVFWRSEYSGDQDDACGAPEGDQIHFRMTGDKDAGAAKPTRFAKTS